MGPARIPGTGNIWKHLEAGSDFSFVAFSGRVFENGQQLYSHATYIYRFCVRFPPLLPS